MLHLHPSHSSSASACQGCCTKLVDFGVSFGCKVVLEKINLHIHCGELTAITGPNGAGKSTLLRAMLGEVPHSGKMSFVKADGATPFGRPRVGYVPQKLELDRAAPITVQDLFVGAHSRWPLWFGYRANRVKNAEEMLGQVEAGDLLGARVGQLSCGQMQRVLLALALNPLPDLLLLDEPVAGVDRAGIELFYETVSKLRRNYDLSIIMVSHDLEAVAAVSDRMIYLNHTILHDGSPESVLSQPALKGRAGGRT